MIFRLLFVCLAICSFVNLEALERDYSYEGKKVFQEQSYPVSKIYEYITDEVCKACFRQAYGFPEQFEIEGIEQLPELSTECTNTHCIVCGERPFYAGYVHFTYRNDYPFLKRQLCFLKKFPHIDAFWPETSIRAQGISDLAVREFKALFENTGLDNFYKYSSFRKKFVVASPYLKKFNKEIISKFFVTTCFWFSDYYQVVEDLRLFAKSNLPVSNQDFIDGYMEDILEKLSIEFIDFYEDQQELFSTSEISQEIELIKYLNGTWNGEEEAFDDNTQSDIALEQPQWFLAQLNLAKGQAYNQALLYEDAVEVLSLSIGLNPENPDAYIERAYAYFELQQIDLALDDYKIAKNMKFTNNEFPKDLIDGFEGSLSGWSDQGDYVVINYSYLATEFCSGILKGAKVSVVEFIPSTMGTFTGISQGLWVFACSPNEVSKKFLDNAYNLVKYIKTHSSTELLSTMVPELRELIEEWDAIANSEKSHRIGYIIGKYGVDIFAPCACMKGLKRYQELRHANAMLTFESCLTKEKRIKILEEVAKRETWRRHLFKNGKIQIHWGRQNKHIPGSHNFNSNKGDISLNKTKLELLLSNKCGTGQKAQGNIPYSPGFRERIDFGEVIGNYAHKEGSQIVKTQTTKGIIHYSKDGVHVVPSSP